MWEILEMAIMLILIIIGITQVIYPAFSKEMPFFWLFRKSSVKKLVEAKEMLAEAEIKAEAYEIERRALDKELAGLELENEKTNDPNEETQKEEE